MKTIIAKKMVLLFIRLILLHDIYRMLVPQGLADLIDTKQVVEVRVYANPGVRIPQRLIGRDADLEIEELKGEYRFFIWKNLIFHLMRPFGIFSNGYVREVVLEGGEEIIFAHRVFTMELGSRDHFVRIYDWKSAQKEEKPE